jgi:cell division septation protein DedD
MKKESLKENIAKILGVSSVEKDLAFEIFLEKISDTLNYNQAIKIKGIGAFQLKKSELTEDEKSLIGLSDGKKDKIIYSAFDNKSSRESNSLFLSFDVKAKTKDEFEFDDEIFSPGVGKPILPINDAEESDSSIHMIKKSLESRVTELIEESEKIDDFDIWDDFYSNIEKQPNEEIILDSENDDSFEFQKESIETYDDEQISEDIEVDNKPNQESVLEDFDSDELDDNEIKDFENAFNQGLSNEKNITESFSQDEIDKILNNVEIDSNDDIVDDNKFSSEKDLDAFAELTSILAQSTDNEFDIDENKNKDKIDAVDEDDPFATLEKTFSGEIDEPEEEIEKGDVDQLDNFDNIEEDEATDEFEDSNQNEKDNEKELDDKILASTIEYSPENDIPNEEIPEESAKKKFGRLFWGLATLFVIVTLGGVYFLFFNESDSSAVSKDNIIAAADSIKQSNASIVKPVDKDTTQQIDKVEETPIPKMEAVQKEEVVASNPETNNSKSVLKPEEEIEVSNFIFTNGKEYSVQVSSWKSKDIADREAERLKSLGYKTAVVAANLKKLGTWYRVRVGYFSSIEKAKEFQNKQK